MPEFWVIAGLGHCATQWLVTILGARENIIGLHEHKQKITGMPWYKAAAYEHQYGLDKPKYKPYFESIRNAQADIVVDANSWNPALLPDVNEMMPISRVIYIVRHGVSQLHSLSQSSAWDKAAVTSHIYNAYMRMFFDLSGYEDDTMDWASKWERLCLFWQGSTIMPYALEDAGLPVELLTFEDLTQGKELRTIIPTINDKDIVNWRGKDINRKVEGDRRPDTLWELWTDSQREAFMAFCAEGMERSGYSMPGE